MILVIGGVGSGKGVFVRQALGYGAGQIAPACLDERPVLCDLQEMLRDTPPEDLLPRLLEKQVVVCDEVGCGVVPMHAAERAWREAVGRLCCDLAAEATAVVRLCCGVPTLIKGRL